MELVVDLVYLMNRSCPSVICTHRIFGINTSCPERKVKLRLTTGNCKNNGRPATNYAMVCFVVVYFWHFKYVKIENVWRVFRLDFIGQQFRKAICVQASGGLQKMPEEYCSASPPPPPIETQPCQTQCILRWGIKRQQQVSAFSFSFLNSLPNWKGGERLYVHLLLKSRLSFDQIPPPFTPLFHTRRISLKHLFWKSLTEGGWARVNLKIYSISTEFINFFFLSFLFRREEWKYFDPFVSHLKSRD